MCTSENVGVTSKRENPDSDINIQNHFWGFIQVNKLVTSMPCLSEGTTILVGECSVILVLAHEASMFAPTGPGTMPLPVTCRSTKCSAGVQAEPNLLDRSTGGPGLLTGCVTVQRSTSFVSCMFESKLLRFLGKIKSWMLSSN